jgi:nucleotide-binding universal stress UspA family protein
MSQSIVCGVDGTQESRWAARVAGDFARELDRTLVLVHVAENPPTFPYGDARLRELQRRDAVEAATPMLERTSAYVPDVEREIKVVFGDAAEALIAVASEQCAELLVVGSRGRGPLASVVLGSVSARLAAVAPCPVVVVPSPHAADRWLARPANSRLVCGVDDSVGSVRAVRHAAVLAHRLDLRPSSVHVDADSTWEDAPLAPPRGSLASPTVFAGDPVEILREQGTEPDTSLLVVGSRGGTSWRAPLGSVSRQLAASAAVPVLVVPPTASTQPEELVADGAVEGVVRRARHRSLAAAEHEAVRYRAPVEDTAVGRFSTGIEQLADTPSKRRKGRFSTGIEQRARTRGALHVGSFGDGIAQRPATAVARRIGSFADSDERAR